MREYSKALLIVFLCACAIPVIGYEVRAFLALFLDKAKPDTVIAGLAFTSGFVTLVASFAKSYAEKNSLNKYRLKLVNDDVVPIDAAPKPETDSDETPEKTEEEETSNET